MTFSHLTSKSVESRSIAQAVSKSSASGGLQAKLNNSPHQLAQLRKVASLKGINFQAGIGSGWHIHKGHIKYGTNNATRVNFANRTRQQIGYELQQVIDAQGLNATKTGTDFLACTAWLRANVA